MTNSSSDAVTVPAFDRELRTGTWTRLGDRQVLGDPVTEGLLSNLVEEAKAAARAQGYSTGWAEGRRAAEERAQAERLAAAERAAAEEARREEEHRAAVQALRQAVADFERATADVAARVESHATEVALALTEELLGHELRVAENPGLDAVRRALALAPAETVVRVRLCPEEAGGFDKLNQRGSALDQRGDGLDRGEGELDHRGVGLGVHVVPDPSLRRGEAVVETDEAVLDARVWGAMDRVRAALSGGAAR